ncbi:tRNA (mnm(5)s(2)U34)-methyltransferase [Peptoniphilus mikwangii]|uniref:tRNA (mnm(5)s(2)U34)-methyltransferase n=1 Tax=Peptoniphilus mikwangii TaxID=1354300 RepID=UPI0004000EBF|nr:class I SAM-dependent methyltransferase [Peptoniphilus mikwangii]
MSLVKYNYRQIVDDIIENANIVGKVCLDATCGRGNDSLKLLDKIGIKGFLYACDIQEEAINSTMELLKSKGYENFKLFNKSHTEVFDYIKEPISLIIYNLGYLPKSDKKVVTEADSTIFSIERGLNSISKDGIIIVVSYLGHEGSFEERAALEKFLSQLEQKEYMVEKREFFNQQNNPPIVYLIGVRK